jgi:hypothetical protein
MTRRQANQACSGRHHDRPDRHREPRAGPGRIGGFYGSFVGALLAIPAAGALRVITRELWHATARPQ